MEPHAFGTSVFDLADVAFVEWSATLDHSLASRAARPALSRGPRPAARATALERIERLRARAKLLSEYYPSITVRGRPGFDLAAHLERLADRMRAVADLELDADVFSLRSA